MTHLFHFAELLLHLMVNSLRLHQLLLNKSATNRKSVVRLHTGEQEVRRLCGAWCSHSGERGRLTCSLLISLRASMCSFLRRSISSRSSESDSDGCTQINTDVFVSTSFYTIFINQQRWRIHQVCDYEQIKALLFRSVGFK